MARISVVKVSSVGLETFLCSVASRLVAYSYCVPFVSCE